MKYIFSTITCLFLLSFISTNAQVNDTLKSKELLKNQKGIFKIILESDPSTKSVLVSNVKEDKAGDMSPVIGAADWIDKGKELFCRSLLEFNIHLLPVEITNNPSFILKAKLVLFPINTEFAVNDNTKKSVVYIRQVLDKWEDSSITWKNQPNTNLENQKAVIIKAKNKNIPATIDVTDIFLNDIMKGKNNGFMISYGENRQKSVAAGQLFASPKYEDSTLRPQLVLYVEYTIGTHFAKKASAIKPVDNLLNDLYLKRDGRYNNVNDPNKNFIYQINLRTGSPGNPPKNPKKVIAD